MLYLKKYLSNTSLDQVKSATVAYLAALDEVSKVSPLISQAIVDELTDQRSHLKLIASENYSSLATQLAMGNLLTDKYAEGYAKHRFYAGCNQVDVIEEAAVNELKDLFQCEHAYVQPHSGADANLVAFWSILIHRVQNAELEKLGKKSIDELSAEEYERIRQLMCNQKVMGLSLGSGGHLTHGYLHNVSSKMMKAVAYQVDPQTELLDYEAIRKQAKEERPTILLAGYSSYPRKIDFAKMREIADEVEAILMVDMAHFSGLVAGQVFQGDYNPIPYAHFVTSTTHKTLRGPRGGIVMCKKEFAETVNKGCPLILGGPLPHVMAAKAIAFKEANTPEFKTYSQNVVSNAKALAEALMQKGIKLITNGTDNHLMVLNISSFGLTGRQAEQALRNAGVTVNRNAIPFDQNGAWYTSGLRFGTPALTTLGMGQDEMREVADMVYLILSHTQPGVDVKTSKPSRATFKTDEKVLEQVQSRVKSLLKKFPLYPEVVIDSN